MVGTNSKMVILPKKSCVELDLNVGDYILMEVEKIKVPPVIKIGEKKK